MKKNEVFTFTAPNGAEVTAVCLDVTHSFQCGEDTWCYEYLCYAQNRLFIGTAYTVYEGDEYKEYDFTQERVVVDYAVLPDYDSMLEDYYHQLDMANDYSDCCTFIDPVVKYQTRIEAEEWCAAHNIPVSALKEERSGFVFTKTFSYV